jgi:Zn-finger nucleic acid-binding protein
MKFPQTQNQKQNQIGGKSSRSDSMTLGNTLHGIAGAAITFVLLNEFWIGPILAAPCSSFGCMAFLIVYPIAFALSVAMYIICKPLYFELRRNPAVSVEPWAGAVRPLCPEGHGGELMFIPGEDLLSIWSFRLKLLLAIIVLMLFIIKSSQGWLWLGLLISVFLFLGTFYHIISLNMGAYRCFECQGEMLNMKQTVFALYNHPITPEEILQQGTPCGLDCPVCESEMVSTPLIYIAPRERNPAFDGMHNRGGGPLAVIILGLVVVGAVSHEASQTRKKRTGTIEIDGCDNCGSFWFNGGELSAVELAADVVDEASEKARQKARKERVHTHRDYSGSKRAQNTNCKEEKCRRVTYRSSEYCYMHQPDSGK